MYDVNGNFVRGGNFCDGSRRRVGGKGAGFGRGIGYGAGTGYGAGFGRGTGRGFWAQQNVTGAGFDVSQPVNTISDNSDAILNKLDELSVRIEKIEKLHGGR
jgi:hypothetical protein